MSRLHWFIAAAAFVAIFAFGAPFPAIVLAAAVLGFIVHPLRIHGGAANSAASPARTRETAAALPAFPPAVAVAGRKEKGHEERPSATVPGAVRVLAVCLLLWFTPLLLVYIVLGPAHVLTVEGVFFSKMAVVTFGGAYAALAYVAQAAVQRYDWLSADEMMQGLALAETTPGPLILVLTFVGFVAAFGNAAPLSPMAAGLLGAALTTWVTFVPCFLWILLGAPHLERLRRNQALSAALASVTAAVVGVILNLAVWFGLHALFAQVRTLDEYGLRMPIPTLGSVDVAAAVIAAASMIALLRFRTPMIPTLIGAAGAGLLVRMV